MKIKISYTIEADVRFRRALACYRGKHGKTETREEIIAHAIRSGTSIDGDIGYEYDRCERCKRAKP